MVTMIHPNPTETAQNPFEIAVFEQNKLWQNNSEPDWLQQRRQLALEQYKSLGFPTRRSEAWKAINLKQIANHSFEASKTIDSPELINDTLIDETLESLSLNNTDAVKLVFINGQYHSQYTDTDNLPEGLWVSNIQNGLLNHPDVMEKYLGQNSRTTQDAFVALNFASFQNGGFIHVAKGLKTDQPIQLIFIQSDDTASAVFNRNIIVAEENSQANISLHAVSLGASQAFNNTVTEIVADASSNVEFTTIQQESPETVSLLSTSAQLSESALLRVNGVNFSGQSNRHQLNLNLTGENARVENYCLNVLKDNNQGFIQSEIHHQVPNCTSEQIIKNVLDDHSKTEFSGTIFVHKDAQQTDAQQLSRGLLLSDNAVIYARPQLQIDADDVKCAHGATVGQLNPDELFYLASRGIAPDVARCILTFGFAQDVLTKVSNTELRTKLSELLLAQLGHDRSPLSCFTRCEDCHVSETHC